MADLVVRTDPRFFPARFDIRGPGLPDSTCREQGLDAWVRDIEAVAESLGWQQFDLLGLCRGAAIASRCTQRPPQRVKRVLLHNRHT